MSLREELHQLFVEYAINPEKAKYTLKDEDVIRTSLSGQEVVYPSLYKKYMEMEDILELTFATTYFGDLPTWETFQKTWFGKKVIDRWRKELEIKVRAKALLNIQKIAQDEDHKLSYNANRLLLDGGWKPKEAREASKRGRPSKAEIAFQTNLLIEEDQDYKNDLERLKELN